MIKNLWKMDTKNEDVKATEKILFSFTSLNSLSLYKSLLLLYYLRYTLISGAVGKRSPLV